MIPIILALFAIVIGEPFDKPVNSDQWVILQNQQLITTITRNKVNQDKLILNSKINEIIENLRENNFIPDKTTTDVPSTSFVTSTTQLLSSSTSETSSSSSLNETFENFQSKTTSPMSIEQITTIATTQVPPTRSRPDLLVKQLHRLADKQRHTADKLREASNQERLASEKIREEAEQLRFNSFY